MVTGLHLKIMIVYIIRIKHKNTSDVISTHVHVFKGGATLLNMGVINVTCMNITNISENIAALL